MKRKLLKKSARTSNGGNEIIFDREVIGIELIGPKIIGLTKIGLKKIAD
jgi:hypothetical protein